MIKKIFTIVKHRYNFHKHQLIFFFFYKKHVYNFIKSKGFIITSKVITKHSFLSTFSVKIYCDVIDKKTGNPFFLKGGINSFSIENEARLTNIINNFNSCFFIKYNSCFKTHMKGKLSSCIIIMQQIPKTYCPLFQASMYNKENLYVNLIKCLDFMKLQKMHHCDLSKKNIFVNKYGDIFVIDFGLTHIDGIDNYGLYKNEEYGNGYIRKGQNILIYDDSISSECIAKTWCNEYYISEDFQKRRFPFEIKV